MNEEKKDCPQEVKQMSNNAEKGLKTQFKPISCPRCNHHNIAYTSKNHKSIWCRTIKALLILTLAFVIVGNIGKMLSIAETPSQNITTSEHLTTKTNIQPLDATPPIKTTSDSEDDDYKNVIITVLIFLGFVQVLQWCIESTTQVQCICKDCGKIWTHKDIEE